MNSRYRFLIFVGVAAVLSGGLFLGAGTVLTAAEPVLSVTVAGKALNFTAEEFAVLPHTTLTALETHTQKEHQYNGVTVRELLVRAGAPIGEKLQGASLRLSVIARCQDGYAVAFGLADFDERFNPRTILLAEKEDGKPLPEKFGPLQLVIPGDKKGARWARNVRLIEVVGIEPTAPVAPVKP